MRTKALFKNIRVADFSWMGVGPYLGKHLSEYGAEVIKIESTSRPDPLRTMPPFKDDIPNQESGLLFADANTSKWGLSLNLKNSKAIEVAKRLIARSDIVIEGFTPGVMESMGLNYEELKKIKTDIIMVSTSMQGQTGPHAGTPGTGMALVSLAGITEITGWPDRLPSGIYGPYTDFIAPLFGAAALHAALDYQQRTGKGQHLDLSQLEASVQFMSPLLLDYEVNQRIAQRTGNSSPYAAPHGVYRCSGEDAWCAIAVFDDKQWKSFCRVIGDPNWTKDSKFATFVARFENLDELDKLVEGWTSRYTPQEVMEKLQTVRIPAGIVHTNESLWNDPQLNYSRAFCEYEHPSVGPRTVHRRSLDLSKMDWEIRPHPLLGEHTEYVCRKILGMSDEEFVSLMGEGVFD